MAYSLGRSASSIERRFPNTKSQSPKKLPNRQKTTLRLELALEQVVDQLGIGFAAAALHDLADQEAERLRLPGAVLSYCVRVAGQHIRDNTEQRRLVADLRQSF